MTNQEMAKLLRQAYLHTLKMELQEAQECLGKVIDQLETSK
jgi:hypothetical protein